MENGIKRTVVIDLGSGDTKVGFAEDDDPICTIPTRLPCDDDTKPKNYIFDDSIQPPIEHGIIKNFDHVENLLEHIFTKELAIRCEEHPVLLSQPPKNPQKDRERLAEIMFEKFNAPALYEEVHSVLAFNASGRSAGLIVESGHGVTSVVPILSGYVISEAILRLDVGGGDIDLYLANKLNEKKPLDSPIRSEEAKILKEKLCYVPEINHNAQEERTYVLPDGKSVTLNEELCSATDPLFDPSLVEQYDSPGLHEMIFQSIFKCGVDLRREFANNIILSGGNTLFEGMETRLRQELEARVPPSMKLGIVAYPDRKVLVWRGGSFLGSLSTFYKNICVSKQEYKEFGGPIIRKKCLNGL